LSEASLSELVLRGEVAGRNPQQRQSEFVWINVVAVGAVVLVLTCPSPFLRTSPNSQVNDDCEEKYRSKGKDDCNDDISSS
jgi:hypothetical protein